MIKQIILLLKIFPFLALTHISDDLKDNLSIEMSVPEKVEKPGEFEVKLAFLRGGVKGFAKFTEQLPNGFSAEAVSIGDATFTCENGMIKILWLNLPDDKKFEVTYKVIVDASAPLELNLGGKFSYLENNEKRIYSIPSQKIICATPAELLAREKESSEKNKKVTPEASVVRRISEVATDVFDIELSISKKGLEGFTKIEEISPMGAKVIEKTSENAVFSFVNKKVKFVWMSPPEKDDFTVVYTLDLRNASNKDPLALKGEISFLVENETRKVKVLNLGESADEKAAETPLAEAKNPQPVPPKIPEKTQEAPPVESAKTEETITAEQEKVAEVVPPKTVPQPKIAEKTPETPKSAPPSESAEPQTSLSKPENAIPAQQPKTPEKPIPAPPIRETPQTAAVEKSQPQPVDMSKFTPPAGLVYRVQIAAGKNLVDAVYFEKRHEWKQEFFIENHEGWVKYTTGKHGEYKQARDTRELISAAGHKFDGPFVTAYSDGKRITVQEALMISNQKWYK
jgi:hypothetical protein